LQKFQIMKKVFLSLFILLVFLSCKKDEIVIKGIITNELTGEPVPNINVGAFTLGEAHYSIYEPYVYYRPDYRTWDVTGVDGSFSFTLPKGDKAYYLASDMSGDWFHPRASINGIDSKFFYGNIAMSNADGYIQLDNSTDLTIKLDPKPLVRFDFPPIPSEWKDVGIFIFSNVITMFIFNLDDSLGLQQLKNIIYGVSAPDQHVKGTFKVINKISNETYKEGAYDVFCPIGETTTIWFSW
jgi:hypothetical protein